LINKALTPAARQILLPLKGLFSILLITENKGILFIKRESPFLILLLKKKSPEYKILNKFIPFCNKTNALKPFSYKTKPFKGGNICRAANVSGLLISKDKYNVIVKLNSG